jgi:hypothetical protein
MTQVRSIRGSIELGERRPCLAAFAFLLSTFPSTPLQKIREIHKFLAVDVEQILLAPLTL